MTTGHTPGPWHVKNGYSTFQVWAGDTTPVADTFTLTIHADEAEANARLIATAPDLFRIGRALLDYSRHGTPDAYELNSLLSELEEVLAGVTEGRNP